MLLYNLLIAACWLLFIAYWAFMARGAKRSIGSYAWRKQLTLRLVIVLVAVMALRFPGVVQALRVIHGYTADQLFGSIGTVICGAGIGFAIWARTVLGRNWGMPMSRKQDPELVTRGPYAYVRHPIYTGIIFGMLGSAMASTLLWVVPLLLSGSYFVYSARQEEKLMLQQFPVQYPAYMQRTKMLLPFLY
jgi:protein-S-isoprenylcysteine O-methyltransferase Ste14